MPGDRLLGTLLRSLQTYTDQQDTPRLLGSASSLLTTLNNPLNVALLTSQILSAPAIWAQPEGLRTSTRCLSVFHSAAQALVRHEKALKKRSEDEDFSQLQLERTLPLDDWIKAVINGADDHSPRWRHLLVIGGLLLGFGPIEDENISRSMRSTLEEALTTATNLGLETLGEDDDLGPQSITVVLNYCFPLFSDYGRDQLDYDSLLPVLMRSTWHSVDGLRSAYFLGPIDRDVRAISASQFEWSERSPSFQEVQAILSSPLISSLGPLSRLIAHSVDHSKQSWLVTAAVEDLETFAKTLHLQWRQIKLSEIDASEDQLYLGQETQQKTAPQLWKLLRSTVFAVVIVLRSIIGRTLSDGALANSDGEFDPRCPGPAPSSLTPEAVAPDTAARTLQTLRSLYFISSRQGSSSFSQYTFVYLTSMDILAAHSIQADVFIQSVKPVDHSSVPQHPLDRNLDLFFLNTAEHFTLVLPSHLSEDLLVPAASPYLAAGGNNNLLPIFEAAHSVMLAVFSAPQNAQLTARQLPFYIEALFNVYPHNLTARQFRLAFKTLLRLTSPPAILAATDPMLSATLLDLLYERAKVASTEPLFPHPSQETSDPQDSRELSEQAVLILTIIDTLPQLQLDLLDEWLPLSADLVNTIKDNGMREHCKEHFWHILVGGEMDPDRSGLCQAWWSTEGGRELLLFGREQEPNDEVMMSGALPDPSSSKL